MYLSNHVLIQSCTYQTMYLFNHVLIKQCTYSTMYLSNHVLIHPCTYPTMYLFNHVLIQPCTYQTMCYQIMYLSNHVLIKPCTYSTVYFFIHVLNQPCTYSTMYWMFPFFLCCTLFDSAGRQISPLYMVGILNGNSEHNAWRKIGKIRFVTPLALIKFLKISGLLLTCAPISELPSNLSTMHLYFLYFPQGFYSTFPERLFCGVHKVFIKLKGNFGHGLRIYIPERKIEIMHSINYYDVKQIGYLE